MSLPSVDDVIGKIRKIVEDAKIVSSDNFREKRSDAAFAGVKAFRRTLFRDEIEQIKELMEKVDDDVVDKVNGIVDREFTDFLKISRYVAYNSFDRNYMAKVEELKAREAPPYPDLLDATLELQRSKEDLLRNRYRFYIRVGEDGSLSEPTPRTRFMLFLVSFFIAALRGLLENKYNYDQLEEVVSKFRVDFVYGFSYIESRAHTVIMFEKGVDNIVARIQELIRNREEMKNVFLQMKNYVKKKGYKYDIKYPASRSRHLFGKEWESFILVAYPEAARSFERELTAYGVRTVYRRRAGVLYLEFMLSKENPKEMLLVVNKPWSSIYHRKDNRVREVLNDILVQMFGVGLNQLLDRGNANYRIYCVDADKIVREIKDALSGRPASDLVNAMESFKKTVIDRVRSVLKDKKVVLQYKDKIRNFIDTLDLAGIEVQLRVGKRVIMKTEVMHANIGIGDENKLTYFDSLNDLSRFVKHLTDEIEDIVNEDGGSSPAVEQWFSIKLCGKADNHGDISIIEFTNRGDVFFHNMSREYATELSYVLWRAFKNGKSGCGAARTK